jgi:hypothetical protein
VFAGIKIRKGRLGKWRPAVSAIDNQKYDTIGEHAECNQDCHAANQVAQRGYAMEHQSIDGIEKDLGRYRPGQAIGQLDEGYSIDMPVPPACGHGGVGQKDPRTVAQHFAERRKQQVIEQKKCEERIEPRKSRDGEVVSGAQPRVSEITRIDVVDDEAAQREE